MRKTTSTTGECNNYQGINDRPSKTIQQWIKELKWTNKFRDRD